MGAELGVHRVVVDSWPVMEWIKRREPARTHFNQLIDDAVKGLSAIEMSRINYGEVICTIRKAPDLLDREEALHNFLSAPIKVHSVDDALVDEAAELKSKYPFAYADAFAAALAIRLGVPLVTGDPEFRALQLDGLLALQWVGR
jgi:predicted nucleic acid-binding protein